MTTPPTPVPGGAVAKATSAWGQAALAAGGKLSYSPTNFYVRATDAKGHGKKIAGDIPPDVYAQIQVMVHTEIFGDYTMPMDFVRDAIVHHLEHRRAQLADPALREAVAGLLRRLAFKEFIEQTNQAMTDWASMEETLRETLIKLQRDRAYAHIWELLDRTEELADPIAEPYRSQVFETVAEWRDKVPPEHRPD